MRPQRVITVGGSAGGLEALRAVVAGLPEQLDAAVFAVIHVPASHPSQIPRVLQRTSRLPVAHATDGEPVSAGRLYIAPPNEHMLLVDGTIRLTPGPHENHHRPAVDPLFRSAAHAYGPGVIGVVLSGALDDGTAGLHSIKRHGGVAIVQDPDDAAFPGMTQSALDNVDVDHRVAARDIGPLIARLTAEPLSDLAAGPEAESQDEPPDARVWPHSEFSCPDCGGVLNEVIEDGIVHLRCRVGHAYSPETLAEGQDRVVETSIWIALRALEESMSMAHRLASRARQRGDESAAVRYEARINDLLGSAEVLRTLVEVNEAASG